MRLQALCAAAVAAYASVAFAVPRETVTLTNQLSNPPPCDPGSAPFANATLVGGYAPKFLVFNGQLAAVATPTLPSEATIQIISPYQKSFSFQPFQGDYFGPTMTIDLTNYVVRVPIDIADAVGTWSFRFSEQFNDTGDDARWNTLSITFDDGPPAAKDLGVLNAQGVRRALVPLAANQVLWYRLDIPRDILSAAGTYLDIDTAASAFADTMIGVYNSSGVLMAYDDDDAGSGLSALTFGAGTRPGIITGYPFDGRDGPLPAGTYYLAVCGYTPWAYGPTGWNISSASSFTGSINLHLQSNVTPRAPHVGTLSQDGIVQRDIPLTPGQVQWLRFEVADDAVSSGSFFVDIDTRGSNLPGSYNNNDTVIAIYDQGGNIVAIDDDGAGVGNLSLLSFGAGTRPPIGPGGINRAGQNGPLTAGTYYLGLTAFPASWGTSGWTFSSAHARTGTIEVHFLTNTGAPAICPADLDNGTGTGTPDGGITIDDLLYFLMHYEGGC